MKLTRRRVGNRWAYSVKIGRLRLTVRRATWKWSRFSICRGSRTWWPFQGAIFFPCAVLVVFTGGET